MLFHHGRPMMNEAEDVVLLTGFAVDEKVVACGGADQSVAKTEGKCIACTSQLIFLGQPEGDAAQCLHKVNVHLFIDRLHLPSIWERVNNPATLETCLLFLSGA